VYWSVAALLEQKSLTVVDEADVHTKPRPINESFRAKLCAYLSGVVESEHRVLLCNMAPVLSFNSQYSQIFEQVKHFLHEEKVSIPSKPITKKKYFITVLKFNGRTEKLR
jgi:hypothetical protein